MSDWFPQVVIIESIRKHPDADALDIATVLGDYPIIIKRDEYKVGDLACYLPIDTIVPDTQDFYMFCPKAYEKYEDENGVVQQRQMGPKYPVGSVPEKYRIIKAKRIRGTYSQGMLVQVSVLVICGGAPLLVGDSVAEVLDLKKWEESEEENILVFKKTRGINAEKAPVGWAIPHYDIDGIRKYLNCLGEDEPIVLTEKLHGSNASFCHDGTKLWVKSRNFYKRMDPNDMWWDVALRLDLETKLAKFPMKVFFGEVYGQVKGFRYDCVIANGAMDPKVRFFDIWDLSKLRYMDYDQRVSTLLEAEVDPVPELYRGVWSGKDIMYPYAEGLTILGSKHIREGFVLNTLKERYEPRLDSRMQVKLVGEGYNLKK